MQLMHTGANILQDKSCKSRYAVVSRASAAAPGIHGKDTILYRQTCATISDGSDQDGSYQASSTHTLYTLFLKLSCRNLTSADTGLTKEPITARFLLEPNKQLDTILQRGGGEGLDWFDDAKLEQVLSYIERCLHRDLGGLPNTIAPTMAESIATSLEAAFRISTLGQGFHIKRTKISLAGIASDFSTTFELARTFEKRKSTGHIGDNQIAIVSDAEFPSALEETQKFHLHQLLVSLVPDCELSSDAMLGFADQHRSLDAQDRSGFRQLHLSLTGTTSNPTQHPSGLTSFFDDSCGNSDLVGFSSIILAARKMLAKAPADVQALAALKGPTGVTTLSKDASVLGARSKGYSIELNKTSHSHSIGLKIRTELNKETSFKLVGSALHLHAISVTGMALKLAPLNIDTSKALDDSSIQEISTEQEMNHFAEQAHAIVEKVCEHVEFDDISLVPDMLAEAVLRTVRPLTSGLNVQELSLDYKTLENPFICTTTVSSNDIALPIQERKKCTSDAQLEHVRSPCKSAFRALWINRGSHQ